MPFKFFFASACITIAIAFAVKNSIAQSDYLLPAERTPLPNVRAAQEERQDETISLLKIALDSSKSTEERAESVSKLGGIRYDYFLANGEKLVSTDALIVKKAISVIGGEIAMIHGHHADGSERDELSLYQDKVVKRSESFLKKALDHTDFTVRLEASNILLSRGKKDGLLAIDNMIKAGEITPKVGVGYMSLAPIEESSVFVEKYVTEGDTDAQAAAIAQLSYNPAYVDKVRGIALASGTNEKVIAAALPGLARTDIKFLEYGVDLAGNAELDNRVREAAIVSTLGLLGQRLKANTNPEETKKLTVRIKSALDITQSEKAVEAYRTLEQQM